MGVHTWTYKLSKKQPTIDEVRKYHLSFWEKLVEGLSNDELLELGVSYPDEYNERLKIKNIVIRELNKPKLDSVYMNFEDNDKTLFFSKVTNKWYESVNFNIMFRITEDVSYNIINPDESFDKFLKLHSKTMYSDYSFKHNLKGIKNHQREMMSSWKENINSFFKEYPNGLIRFA